MSAQQRAATAALSSAVIALLTLTLTGIGLWLLKGTLDATREAVKDTSIATSQMVEANRIAKDTAQRQLRAYVSVEDILMDQNTDTAGQTVEGRFKIVWRNAGQTPATHFSSDLNWACQERPLPPDFDFPDSPQPDIPSVLVIGPHRSAASLTETPLTPAQAHDTIGGKKHIYLWGWAEYKDVFGKRRRTEVAVRAIMDTLADGKQSMGFSAIDRHNAMDDACMKAPRNDAA